jgi:hypothetical protein
VKWIEDLVVSAASFWNVIDTFENQGFQFSEPGSKIPKDGSTSAQSFQVKLGEMKGYEVSQEPFQFRGITRPTKQPKGRRTNHHFERLYKAGTKSS